MWTTIDDLDYGDDIDDQIWNQQVKGNLEYLLAGRPLQVVYLNEGADYTTTSQAFIDVDTANLKLEITPVSSRVLVLAALRGGADDTAGNRLKIGWRITPGWPAFRARVGQNMTRWIGLIHRHTGLTPGTTYTFYLQFAGDGGVVTIYRDGWPITLIALEV